MICVSITSIEKYQHLHGSITMDEYSLWFDTPTVNNNIRRYLVHLYGTEEEEREKISHCSARFRAYTNCNI